MRRKILYAVGLVLMSVSLNSCEGLFENCKMCRRVTYIAGNVTDEGTETEYCGTDLVTIQATPPLTVGTQTIQWECR
jgi:hypothetical protein